jgi:hypothetical protein
MGAQIGASQTRLMNVAETAEFLRVSPETLYTLVSTPHPLPKGR